VPPDGQRELVRPAESWDEKRADGAGPFTSRLVWGLPDGGEATWESRPARKRGAIKVRTSPDEAPQILTAPPEIARRLARVNWVAALAFTIGGTLFAIGAWVAQLGSGDASTSASIYFVGGLFFNTGGYASFLGAVNAPRAVGADGAFAAERWRWWSYEPQRIDWLSTFVLFAGTIAFGVSLADSFIQGLSGPQINRLIWTPETFGCILFLISGHLGFVEICHRGYPCWRPRDLGWAIVAINQVGSVFFMISALAGLIRPATGSAVSLDVANWGTLLGAACFAIGGVMQAFDRPQSGST
jgi:hypothetical protein